MLKKRPDTTTPVVAYVTMATRGARKKNSSSGRNQDFESTRKIPAQNTRNKRAWLHCLTCLRWVFLSIAVSIHQGHQAQRAFGDVSCEVCGQSSPGHGVVCFCFFFYVVDVELLELGQERPGVNAVRPVAGQLQNTHVRHRSVSVDRNAVLVETAEYGEPVVQHEGVSLGFTVR